MGKNIINKPAFYRFTVLKEGLVTSKDNKWKMRRKMIEPFFASKQQRVFLPTIDQVFDSMVKSEFVKLSDKGKPVTLSDQIHSTTCDIILNVTLNIPIEGKKEDKIHIIDTIDLREMIMMRRIFNPLLWIDGIFCKTELGKNSVQMTERFYDFFESSVEQVLGDNSARIQSNGIKESPSVNDLVNTLMKTGNGKIDLQGISEEVLTTVSAGHETTATALNWTLFVLGK